MAFAAICLRYEGLCVDFKVVEYHDPLPALVKVVALNQAHFALQPRRDAATATGPAPNVCRLTRVIAFDQALAVTGRAVNLLGEFHLVN